MRIGVDGYEKRTIFSNEKKIVMMPASPLSVFTSLLFCGSGQPYSYPQISQQSEAMTVQVIFSILLAFNEIRST